MVNFAAAPVAGALDVRWVHGAAGEPDLQVHAYDEHTYILRQSKNVTYEAPFLYLLFGNDRAFLLDTGATEDGPLRETVDGLIETWLAAHPRDGYELVVAHTHGHGDHVAGDAQFAGRPRTTVVGKEPEAVQAFFGFDAWPDQNVRFDLGGRVLDLTAIPGHQRAAIAIFDPWTGFLLTGDTVYPGRLYGLDMAEFVTSMDRLVAFAQARPVTHVMGTHIEMSRKPKRDYPIQSTFQPDEPPLQMTMAQLLAVQKATRAAADKPGLHMYDDFGIFNGTGKLAMYKLMLHSKWRQIRK